ncbi:MAG: ABC transporter permease [Saprospiraceae bacterium]|nr:ABC transporter permease [Saprospiraceae bacterium]MBK7737177.1 ABC transporter permease [Saprospiraceae bacterium]MBK7914227.1 ABC transporter permease [Saprospiraceae bacterium]
MIFLRIVLDSFNQAIQQLTSNKLRSFLTLLGITIGIFCVIAVLSSVDSLEENIVQSFEKFGNDVIYVDKWPWEEDPGQNFYKYMARPVADINDLHNIQNKSKLSQAASLAVFLPGRTTKFMDVVVEGAYMAGITEDYDKIIKLEFEDGNYFSARDFQIGGNQTILGNKLALSLFPKGNGVGKEINIGGQKFQVVGILKQEGKSIISIMPNDEAVFIPFNTARKLVSINSSSNWGTLLSVKAKKGVDLDELKYEVSSIIRPGRGLKPREKDNFSINRITMLTNLVDKVFGVINFAGFIIGLFSMLVGAFGVANIMFVSVKERTNLIGIKMAIGAKRYFILLEYLIEAIILCIIGGLVGLFIVWAALFILSKLLEFPIYMSFQNIALGISLSILIGIVAGIIPAIIASRMDPVEAIRK